MGGLGSQVGIWLALQGEGTGYQGWYLDFGRGEVGEIFLAVLHQRRGVVDVRTLSLTRARVAPIGLVEDFVAAVWQVERRA